MRFWAFIVLALFLVSISSLPVRAADLSAEDVVSKNLQSIGSPDAINAAKSRVVEGSAVYKVLVGGSGQVNGKTVFVSEGPKIHLLFKIPNYQYLGERLIWNGEKESIAAAYADKRYSEFGDFLKAQDAPMREGLMGGVLTTAWPLLNLQARNAKVSYEGLKKVDGKELHILRYKPKKNTDIAISLYFDPATFHHVMTVYTLTIEPRIGATETQSSRNQETRYRLEERFDNFATVDGLTIPRHYDLRYTAELGNGRLAGFTKSVEWDVTLTAATDNVKLDSRNFDVK